MRGTPVATRLFVVLLFIVQFFAWSGMFALWVFALPHIRSALGVTEAEALRLVGVGLAITVGLGALVAFALPKLQARMAPELAHFLALLVGGIGLMLVARASQAAGLLIGYSLVGMGWGSIGTTPYALISARVTDGQYDRAMARFNLSVVIPQICIALALGPIVAVLTPTIAITLGAASMFMAAALAPLLRLTGYHP